MKNTLILSLLLLSLFPLTTKSQEGFYLGGEFANKRDYYSFITNQGEAVTHGVLSNSYGITIGYQHRRLSFESGLHQFTSTVPEITYDWDHERAYFGRAAHSTDANYTQVIPLRAGYDFINRRNKGFYLRPLLGVMLIYNQTEPYERVVSWFNEEESEFSSRSAGATGSTLLAIPTTDKFSYGIGYATTPFNLGFQAGISVGYRIKEKLDINIAFSTYSSLKLLYFENVTYQYDDELVVGTTSYSGNSTSLQLGVNYYLKKKDIYNSKP